MTTAVLVHTLCIIHSLKNNKCNIFYLDFTEIFAKKCNDKTDIGGENEEGSFPEINSNNIFQRNYVANVGGKNRKDNVHRVLKLLYKNTFATMCSWLGQRNNRCLCTLKSLQIVKGIYKSYYVNVYHVLNNEYCIQCCSLHFLLL